jgi:hypothetical protein
LLFERVAITFPPAKEVSHSILVADGIKNGIFRIEEGMTECAEFIPALFDLSGTSPKT